MRQLILLLFMAFSLTGFGQTIKEQIGTSVWTKRGKVFADSTVTYVISYDKQGRKTREWQIFRDTSGIIVDTNYAELDTAERLIHFFGGKEHWYYEYDRFGTQTKLVAHRLRDTITIVYHPTYNKGKLIYSTRTYNGQSDGDTTTYLYKGRTTIENQSGRIIETVTRNKLKQTVFMKTETNYNNQKSIRVIKYQRDAKGRVLLYTQEKNGILTKKTTHFFKDGIEQSQVEQLFNPDYSVTTTFTYEYWR